MNINRKIQLTAVATVANGALALWLLGAGPAIAASCGDVVWCFANDYTYCINHDSFCMTNTPPGCTYVASTCPAGPLCGPNGAYKITCGYK